MSKLLVLVLPRPWVDWPAGVGYGQDAGVGCGGQGSPAVSSGENLQVIAGAFYQIHFGKITTVQLMERVERIKMVANGITLRQHIPMVCATFANSLLVLSEGNRKDGGSQIH